MVLVQLADQLVDSIDTFLAFFVKQKYMPMFKFNKSRAGESLPIRVLYLSLLSFLNKGLDDYDVRTGFPLCTDGDWHKV